MAEPIADEDDFCREFRLPRRVPVSIGFGGAIGSMRMLESQEKRAFFREIQHARGNGFPGNFIGFDRLNRCRDFVYELTTGSNCFSDKPLIHCAP